MKKSKKSPHRSRFNPPVRVIDTKDLRDVVAGLACDCGCQDCPPKPCSC